MSSPVCCVYLIGINEIKEEEEVVLFCGMEGVVNTLLHPASVRLLLLTDSVEPSVQGSAVSGRSSCCSDLIGSVFLPRPPRPPKKQPEQTCMSELENEPRPAFGGGGGEGGGVNWLIPS